MSQEGWDCNDCLCGLAYFIFGMFFDKFTYPLNSNCSANGDQSFASMQRRPMFLRVSFRYKLSYYNEWKSTESAFVGTSGLCVTLELQCHHLICIIVTRKIATICQRPAAPYCLMRISLGHVSGWFRILDVDIILDTMYLKWR